MGGRGAVPVAIALAVGLTLGRGVGTACAVATLSAGLGCGALAWIAPRRTATLLALAAVALCGVSRAGAHARRVEVERSCLPGAETLVRFTARVCEPPSDAAAEPTAVARLERCEPELPRGARVRLRFPPGTRIEWSDRVAGLAWLDRAPAARNPGGFDARRWADAEGWLATGRVVWCRAAPAQGPGAWPRESFGRWRSALERRLERRVGPHARELVVPLILGDRSGMPAALGAELRVAGLIHLIALSGLHVSWLAQLARTFAAAAGGGALARAGAGAACALFYLGLAGPIPSLARAALTELLGSLARGSSRRLDPLHALAASAVLLLVVRPEWIGDLGFQLSCVATLGLVAIGNLAPGAGHLAGASRLRRAMESLARGVAAGLGAQLASLPIVLAGFHLMPWVAPAANLVAVPVAGLLLAACWIALVGDVVAPGLGGPWFAAADTLAAGLRAIADGSARVPGAALSVASDPALIALAAGGAVLLALRGARRTPLEAPPDRATPLGVLWTLAGATACVCALLLGVTSPERRPPAGRAWVVALDVGQGDAIAIALPDGWRLVDAGPRSERFDSGSAIVLPFLRWAGVRRLERLILTHGDSDHCGGALAVLDGVGTGGVVAPVGARFPPALAPRIGPQRAARGDTLAHEPTLVVLWPPRGPIDLPATPGVTADNRASLVLALSVARTRALMLADVDSSVEARLTEAGVAVLKVAHHGAGSSSGRQFLARARPRLAIVSCGRRNRFGHPDPGALARLSAAGARVRRTDEVGAVWCELTGDGARLVDWRRESPLRADRPAGGGTAAVRAPARP